MAVIGAGHVEIGVCDRHASGYPAHGDRSGPMHYGPLAEACATAWAWDAHFVQYACPSAPYRLATQAALALGPEMRIVAFDVDGPDHRWTPEWWDAERAKIKRLFKDRGRGYAFTSKGGYKILYALAEPVTLREPRDAARWSASYQDWIALLAREYQIAVDENCGDWTRLMRLPRTMRDGVPQTPIDEVGRAETMLRWSEPYAAADDPRCQRNAAAPIDIPVAAPVTDEQLEEAARALAAQWPARGRHHASLALCGALARAGWSDEAIADFVAGVTMLAGGDPDPNKRLAQARSSAEKVARGEDVSGWPSLVEHMLTGPDAQPDESRRAAVEAAVLAGRRSIGQGPPIDLFTLARDAAREASKGPTLEQIRSALKETLHDEVSPRFMELLDEAATAILPAVREASIKRDEKPTSSSRFGMSKRKIRARRPAPPRYLVKDLLLSSGMFALSGEPKAAKSWDLAHITVAVAAGAPVFGSYESHPAGVFTFAIEDTEGSLNVRTDAIAAGMGLDPDGPWCDRWHAQPRGKSLNVMNDWHLCILAASVWIAEEESGCKIQLIAIDPLSDAHDGQEDKRDSIMPVTNRLRAFADAMSKRAADDVALIFVHHAGKSSEATKGRKRGGQKMRGSSALHGAVDGGIYLDNLRGDAKNEFIARIESEVKAARGGGYFDRTLTIEDGPDGNAIKATWATSECKAEDKEPDNLADERASQIVYELWKQGRGPLTRDDLRRKIKGKSDTFERALEAARQEGWIAQQFRGSKPVGWAITDAGVEMIRGTRNKEPEEDPQPAPAKLSQTLGFIAQNAGNA